MTTSKMELSAKEREVIHAMRESDRAHTAIYKYATKFTGDDQAISTQRMGDRYADSYERE